MREDAFDLLSHVGMCRSCGARLALCAYGTCPRCHASGRDTSRAVLDAADTQPVHLCCGWWGSHVVLPWMCPTCGAVRTRRRA